MITDKRTELALIIFVLTLAFGPIGCSTDPEVAGGTGGTGGDPGSEPLRILVTNDDGVTAGGIDIVVQALIGDPNNAVVVSAPAADASGSGDTTVDEDSDLDCASGTGEGTPAETASGYGTDVWAVDGCPADAVLYALENLYPDEEPPHVVLSGINKGQNIGLVGDGGVLSQISGTVGAAKTAACSGVPALASSQGDPPSGEEHDYEAGLMEVLSWLEANRSALLAGEVAVDTITSINIPSCQEGTSIRGQEVVGLGTEAPEGGLLSEQDCESTLQDPQDDIEAFLNGFVSITAIDRNSSGTCDGLN
jgi:5'-nucleotidase